MRACEFLIEKPVESSWIREITYNRPNRIVTMLLNDGKKYYIYDIGRAEFEKWVNASSQGKYWHNDINGHYAVKRVAGS